MRRKVQRDAFRTTRVATCEVLETKRLLAADFLPSNHDHVNHDHDHAFDHGHADHASYHSHGNEGHAESIEEQSGDHTISYSPDGHAYYLHESPGINPDAEPNVHTAERVGQRHGLSSVPILHSHPQSSQKIYLDFDGETVRDTSWNMMNNNRPIHASAYDIDGDIFSFNDIELDRIEEIWRRVSEDFAPFDIDVTTENPGDDALTAGKQAIRVLITSDRDEALLGGTGNKWYAGDGGVAFLRSWRWSSDTPVWVFGSGLNGGNPKRLAETASHEVGHSFGLHHDGEIDGGEYYTGHGEGATSWAPIMGLGFGANVTQWSQGEYTGANEPEDDLAMIASDRNEINYRSDDHSNTNTFATKISNHIKTLGVIGSRHDVDVFEFESSGRSVRINVDVAGVAANLDVLARLFDIQGRLIFVSNPRSSLAVSFSVDLPAGTYFLQVTGTGLGDPATGYSDYGSLGTYAVSVVSEAPPDSTPLVEVVGRHIFYNDSSFDQNMPSANLHDSAAIDPSKKPLLNFSQNANFANYTSYVAGINGVMIDVQNLQSLYLRPSDFEFRVGNSDDPNKWEPAPLPTTINVRPQAGVNGSHRITLIWPNGSIVGKWLRVTLKASELTGLATEDVHFWGNSPGDTGSSSTNRVLVDGTDYSAVLNGLRSFLDPASVDNAFDFNRDRLVDGADLAIVRDYTSNFLQSLQLSSIGDVDIDASHVSANASISDEDEIPETAALDSSNLESLAEEVLLGSFYLP